LESDRDQVGVTGESTSRAERRVAQPQVAVIVVAHGRRDDTLDCLASVARASWRALMVIMVDNGSPDDTADAVAERFPATHVIRQERNLGFAEGNNIGIRRALALGAEYVFLLNNDATIASDTIARCLEAAQRHPEAGALCPVIHFAEPRELIWYAGAIFDPRRARSGRMLGYRELDSGQFTETRETDRMTGAAVLIPHRALERVGLLDAELFFLYEDVDWSLRVRRAGCPIYLVPGAKVWHRVSATSGGEHSAWIAYYDTRNHVIVCRRHAPLRRASALRRDLGILGVHLAGARRARRPAAYGRAVLAGWIDALRGRRGQRC
jgi:GT2 family glycosyltransferase